MTSLPAPIKGEILDLLNRLANCDSPSQFDLYRLNHLIEQLEKVDYPASLSFRGAYYSLQGKFDKAEEYHKEAIKMQPGANTFFNYAMTLQIEEKYAQAVEMLLKAKELCSTDFRCMEVLLQNAAWSGQIALVEEWLPRYSSLTGVNLTVDNYIALLGPAKTTLESDESYAATCASGVLSDWDSPEEEEAWQHLQ